MQFLAKKDRAIRIEIVITNIINYLKKFGQVLTEHIGQASLNQQGESLSDKEIRDRDLLWIKQADIIVAEVTNPSLGVGYELRYAESLNKHIVSIARYDENKLISAMITGSLNITCLYYKDLNDLKQKLEPFFK